MFEKRRYRRIDVNLPVILRYKGRLLPATMLNVSCGGMCIRAEDKDISSDAPVEVIFDLGEEKKDVSMRGLVIRADSRPADTNLGIQFTNLFSLSHKAIQEYLGKNLN